MGEDLTILHISDLHFGPPYVERAGEAVVRAAHELAPRLIVASGDFTQRARPEQFEAARAFLDRLPRVPTVTTPGNHDVPLYRVLERLLRPHALYRRHINDELNFAQRLEGAGGAPGAVIVSLDSTAPLRAITNGRIGREQLDFCARAFERAGEDAVRIVVAHHHFAPAPDYERDQTMPRARRAIDRFIDMRVDMIMGGHLHRAYIGNTLDLYPGPERDRGIIIVQCGTSCSRRGRAREREKNSLNLLRIDERTVRITHFMYFDDLDRFAPTSHHVFPRPGRRGLEPAAALTAATVEPMGVEGGDLAADVPEARDGD